MVPLVFDSNHVNALIVADLSGGIFPLGRTFHLQTQSASKVSFCLSLKLGGVSVLEWRKMKVIELSTCMNMGL